MQELHTAGWYAARIMPYLPKEIFKPVPQRLMWGALFLSLTVPPIIAIGAMTLHPLLNLTLSILIAIGFSGLGFLGHEILHGSVVKNAFLRDLLGGIGFAQFCLGPRLWRKWHNVEHHGHTQDGHTDPDAMATMERFFERPPLQVFYKLPLWVRSLVTFISFLGFFSVFCQLMLKRYYREFKGKDRVMVLLQLAAPVSAWLGLLAVIGPVKWLFAYLIPVAIANFVVISYISTNHQLSPLVEVNDPLANSLTVEVPWWTNVINLNFSHHTEHHLFPTMNPKYAPLVRAKLIELFPDRYHSMSFGRALLSLWRTPRIYMNRVELVDPVRGLTYGSLGNGLTPEKIVSAPFIR